MATAVGLSKVFILDKYFTELQKYWETEKKLKANMCRFGPNVSEALIQVKKLNENISNDVYDLIHLQGPLTEDCVVKTLNARFLAQEYFTNIGPVLLFLNCYKNVKNPLTLSSIHQEASKYPQLLSVVREAVRQQSKAGYPQAIVLSGESGSGKTFSSMILLRQLFDLAGGGPETDSFKHLAAAFTLLRSLGNAKTNNNSESSRIGHFIEVQVTDGAIYRTKIHCSFLDQSRILRQNSSEKNYHIFYQMLAGLSKDEKAKLNLEGYSIQNLRYLNRGDLIQDEKEDRSRFEAWKCSLVTLGIPFMDVLRVLSAILLLGNIQFNENNNNSTVLNQTSFDTFDSKSNNEIKAVASLLGISSVALYRGLTTKTKNVNNQLVKTVCDGLTACKTRDSLAKALYCRTVATIVRRANNMKRIGSTCGTLSSDSNDSIHNQLDNGSHRASTIGSSGNKSQKSLNVLNSAVKHATDGFIGILDMFGYENSNPSHLEHLCINLCAETMQHFYNTHIFKSSTESYKEEGVKPEIDIDYVDNVPCIDFISSLRTGLLSLLDAETFSSGSPELYVELIKAQHGNCSCYFAADKKLKEKQNVLYNENKNLLSEEKESDAKRLFGIRHFAGDVIYDTTHFIEANKDIIPDDVVSLFHKSTCTFGFASHLFGLEIKALFSKDIAPRGISFRLSPTSHNDLHNGNEITSTLTQDFHTRLDNLLRTLVHARPHFIRCIKSNNKEQPNTFKRDVVVKQIRALQILETVNLMACGLPHRMRFKAFSSRYKLIASFKNVKGTEDKKLDDCKMLLESFSGALEEMRSITTASTNWVIGKRHIFLSEAALQHLEMLRNAKRNYAAIVIQSVWRGWFCRKRLALIKTNLIDQKKASKITENHKSPMHPTSSNTSNLTNKMKNAPNSILAPQTNLGLINRPRPQPINGTPPPDSYEQKFMSQTRSLLGIDFDHPPPVPPSRSYTILGNIKLGYPQTRVMKMDFPDDVVSSDVQLIKGQSVFVIGASSKRGFLVIEHKNSTIHVPYQYLELKLNSSNSSKLTEVNI